jgi:hypothetical protein
MEAVLPDDWAVQLQDWQCRKMRFPRAIRDAHEHCRRNRDELAQSTFCGCFYCCSIVAPTQITDWIDPAPEMADEMGMAGCTARCPRCGIDSIIGDRSGFPITRDFLEKMKSYWFWPVNRFFYPVVLA